MALKINPSPEKHTNHFYLQPGCVSGNVPDLVIFVLIVHFKQKCTQVYSSLRNSVSDCQKATAATAMQKINKKFYY